MCFLGNDGKPIYNEDGKVMKGPNYFKPNLKKYLWEKTFLIIVGIALGFGILSKISIYFKYLIICFDEFQPWSNNDYLWSSQHNNFLADSTTYPIDYPDIIRDIYYKQNIINRKPFTSWVGKSGKKFNSDINWWVKSLPVSRNPYMSSLYHYICVIKTIIELKKKFKRFDLIVDSKSLKKVLEKLLDKNSITNIKIRKKI